MNENWLRLENDSNISEIPCIHNIRRSSIEKKIKNESQQLEICLYCSVNKYCVEEIQKWIDLVWFYGISTIVGYLMPNPIYV